MITRKQSGFTMVELLTVIAIIAILAAIIFPIMSAAKASARKTQCISNMEQIFQALQLFKADEHRYPDFIAGPVSWKSPGNAYKFNESKGVTQEGVLVSLYPEYIKATTDLKCPLSRATDIDIQVDPVYDLLHSMMDPWTGTAPPLRYIGEDVGSGNVPFQLYKACTYDIQLPKNAAEYEVHYSTVWNSEDSKTITDTISDQSMREAALARIERQLHWKQPPSDTMITWCSLHRDTAPDGTPTSGSRDIVLFLDGNVRSIPSTVLRDAGWKNVWEKVNPNTGR